MPKFLTALLAAAGAAYAAAPITLTLATRTPGCRAMNQAEVTLAVEDSDDYTPAVYPRMVALWRWFDAARQQAVGPFFDFKVHPPGEPEVPLQVRSLEILGGGAADWTPDPRAPEGTRFRPPDTLRICLTLDRRLPAGSLDASLKFLNPPNPAGAIPTDLPPVVVNHTLAGPSPAAAPGTAAARSFVRELDFAALLLSSVQERAAAGRTGRVRDTKATFDLWLAPILRLSRFSLHPGHNWFTYFTPIAVEAHASTVAIARDSLSQNRIVMGPEYEFRYYLKNANGAASDNVLRWIVMFKDASDRDFKLNEPKFMAEFRPVWGKANRDVLDPSLIKSVPGFRLALGDRIGRRLAPFVGVEKGSSYLRGLPSSALRALGPFTRGYLGIDAGVDFNRRISLATTQTMYVRGEAGNDWVHYMRNTVQWTFLGSRPQFASSVVFSFEKGRLPPFRSDVNAVSLGIRVQSAQWGLGR